MYHVPADVSEGISNPAYSEFEEPLDKLLTESELSSISPES